MSTVWRGRGWRGSVGRCYRPVANVMWHGVACRYEVLYTQVSLNRVVEYIQLGLLDPEKLLTMKVGPPVGGR